MLSLKSRSASALMAVLMFSPIATLSQSTAGESQLTGDWRGDSICVIRDGACHDEKAVYHVADIPGKPSQVAITFNKIVDDRMVKLGTIDCRFDHGTNSVSCEYSTGVWLLEFKGAKVEGTLTLKDKTVFRRITLTKAD